MRSILVGTDLSRRSERAVQRANLLARRISCPLTVIHVVDDDLPTSMAEQMISGAKETIAASLRRIPATEASMADVVVARGEDWRTIVNEAYARNSDLIVLGSHRMTAAGFLHGSTMERVIRATHRTVLVVRDEPRGSYQNVLAAVDFSVASRYAVQAALAVAPDADFHLVHAYQVPLPAFLSRNSARDEALRERSAIFAGMVEDEMATFLAAIGREPRTIGRILKEGAVLEVIESEVRSRKPDLLVLGTHGRTGAALTLLGSVALALLEYPPCDVLVAQAW